MQDDTKVPVQTPLVPPSQSSQQDSPVVPNQPTTPSAVPPPLPPSQPVQPPAPVGLPKEHEPLPPLGNSEWTRLSEPEPQVSEEVQEAGVMPVATSPVITPEQHDAGIMPAKESVPVLVEPAGTVHLPMTMAQAQDTIKSDKDVRDSLHWLATLIFRELEIAERKRLEQTQQSV